jgi:hypothetical protein
MPKPMNAMQMNMARKLKRNVLGWFCMEMCFLVSVYQGHGSIQLLAGHFQDFLRPIADESRRQ